MRKVLISLRLGLLLAPLGGCGNGSWALVLDQAEVVPVGCPGGEAPMWFGAASVPGGLVGTTPLAPTPVWRTPILVDSSQFADGVSVGVFAVCPGQAPELAGAFRFHPAAPAVYSVPRFGGWVLWMNLEIQPAAGGDTAYVGEPVDGDEGLSGELDDAPDYDGAWDGADDGSGDDGSDDGSDDDGSDDDGSGDGDHRPLKLVPSDPWPPCRKVRASGRP